MLNLDLEYDQYDVMYKVKYPTLIQKVILGPLDHLCFIQQENTIQILELKIDSIEKGKNIVKPFGALNVGEKIKDYSIDHKCI